MQWVQNQSENNVDNLNYIRREASRHFRKKEEVPETKIEELETNSKIKNTRDLHIGINDFKKGYQSRTNKVKDEKGDKVADSHKVLDRWINHFSLLLDVHSANGVRQTEIRIAESLVPELSVIEVKMTMEKPKNHKSPGTDPTPAYWLRQGVEQFAKRSINLFLFGIRRNCLKSGRSWSLYLFIGKAIKGIVVIIEAYHFCHLCS